ncbi:MAG: hypothetical protein KGL39_25825 [Patescibacteria group bacterium]|nr:hypothetical protein [Patescibacteria group bacterium]
MRFPIDCQVFKACSTEAGRLFITGALLDEREFPMMDAVSFPKWEQVLPNFAGKRTVRLSFNPALLMAVAESIGFDTKDNATWQTTIEFGIGAEDDQDGEPMRVSVAGAAAGTIAVLMPLKTASRAPNRIDVIEEVRAEAVGEKDINAIDADRAARVEGK